MTNIFNYNVRCGVCIYYTVIYVLRRPKRSDFNNIFFDEKMIFQIFRFKILRIYVNEHWMCNIDYRLRLSMTLYFYICTHQHIRFYFKPIYMCKTVKVWTYIHKNHIMYPYYRKKKDKIEKYIIFTTTK